MVALEEELSNPFFVSLEEIKTAIGAIPEDERILLTAFLRHLNRVNTPENRAELSAANARIDAGDYVTLEQLGRAHADLEARGL